MTVYWQPADGSDNPDSIDVWIPDGSGGHTSHSVDVSTVGGMPDSLGDVAPDAVRALVADTYKSEVTPGNAPVHNQKAVTLVQEMKKLDYERGSP